MQLPGFYVFLMLVITTLAHLPDEFCTPCGKNFTCGDEKDNMVVHVLQGSLLGYRKKSVAGGSFISFEGVPYAADPSGALRFKGPQEPIKWNGIRSATSLGNVCLQMLNGKIIGSEDCLFLNVYTPSLCPYEALPVMMYFHGGVYAAGSSTTDILGLEHSPDYLVAQCVIVVSVNYRLSVFGFLVWENIVSGNMGLKDQVLAMRWVNKNIANFGGDPNKMTIFGQSAGGSCVHLHLLSSMTRPLNIFAAISQSGMVPAKWSIQSYPMKTAQNLARALDCPIENSTSAVECLRCVDMKKLLNASLTEAPTEVDKNRMFPLPFVPTFFEESVHGEEQYLSGCPYQLMREGNYIQVPYMLGCTDNEAMIYTYFFKLFDATVEKIMDENWKQKICPETYVPKEVCNNGTIPEVLQYLREHYMNGQKLSSATLPGFINMISYLQFKEPVHMSLSLFQNYTKSNIYWYSFNIDDKLNVAKVLSNLTLYKGAFHFDDNGYIWSISNMPDVPKNSSASVARCRLTRMYTNMAKYGNPTPDSDQATLGVKWEPYSSDRKSYLEIGQSLVLKTNLDQEEISFWNQLYKTYGYTENVNGTNH